MTCAARLDALPAGRPSLLAARPVPDLTALGWVEREYVASGVATSYARPAGLAGPARLPADGRWKLEPAAEAAYRTRVLVRRPRTAPASGTVVVEWLNVSGGADAAPDWAYLADELLRQGHAWAGVSAQFAGVMTLAANRSGRYASLDHPGDAFAFDILSQVGRAVATLVGADLALAAGASQSAAGLTSYIDGVHPLARTFDGFLVHSRPGGAMPIDVADGPASVADTLAGPPVLLRDDLDVPVLVVQTEGDLFEPLAYLPARQPDGERLRTWEVAGSAHADRYIVGEFEHLLGCPGPVNNGQQAFVLRAGLRHLERWARGGAAPPTAPALPVADGDCVRDRHGNACGGVRTPVLEAPVEVLSGVPVPGAPPLCRVFGSTVPLRGVWGGREPYLAAYADAVEATIGAGFALEEDREALLADARPHLAE